MYLRNYADTDSFQHGMPLRSPILDPGERGRDWTVKSFTFGHLEFNEDNRRLFIPPGTKVARFPMREDGPIEWNITPQVQDLCAGDTLKYLGDTIKVHDLYVRPGADIARITTIENNRRRMVKYAYLDDEANRATILRGTVHPSTIDIESAGPYINVHTRESIDLLVHPQGRGKWEYLTVDPSKLAPTERKEWLHTLSFQGTYETQRHPSDPGTPTIRFTD